MYVNQPDVPIIDRYFDDHNDLFMEQDIIRSVQEDQFEGDEHYFEQQRPLNRWDDRKQGRNHTKGKTGLERLALVDAPGSAGCAR